MSSATTRRITMASRVWLLALGCILSCLVFACGCPPEHLLRPCRCDQDENSLECNGLKGQDVLDGVFRRIGNFQVKSFILRNSKVEHIPSSSVELNAFQMVFVENSVLSQLFEIVPSSNNQLDILSLDSVTIHSGVNFGYLKPFQKLKILVITDTVVPQLGKEFSQSLSQVIQTVNLWNTSTQSIDNAFVGKHKLEDVTVNHTPLTHLYRSSFPYPANNLKMVSLSYNQIETLPADLFEFMSKLRMVYLTGNKISEISEAVFGKVYDQLEDLYLDDNPLKCDCSIKWITLKNNEGKRVLGTCAEPTRLAGKPIIDLKLSDFPDCL